MFAALLDFENAATQMISRRSILNWQFRWLLVVTRVLLVTTRATAELPPPPVLELATNFTQIFRLTPTNFPLRLFVTAQLQGTFWSAEAPAVWRCSTVHPFLIFCQRHRNLGLFSPVHPN